MLRRICLLVLPLLLVPALPTAAGEPISVGNRLEPFVDPYLIDSFDGAASLEIHHPIAREVALVCDKPWEGNTCCYFTVFQDGDLCRMYYRGSHYDNETRKTTHPEYFCYAESKDGIHWTKPVVGIYEYEGSKKNNIVLAGNIGTHNLAPFLDKNPDCPPEAKYKALGLGKGGLYAFQSADAVTWKLMHDKPVITKGAFDSQNLAFYDPLKGCYVDFHRGFKDGVRDIMTCTSKDFIEWTEPEWLSYPGSKPEHLYTNAIAPYFRAPHIYLGFPKRFVPARHLIPDVAPGVSDAVFMSSRDGKNFHRFAEAIVRPGLQKERWVNRNNMTAWGRIVTKGTLPGTPDEISIYTTEAYYKGEASRLRRHTFRLDGFASIQGKGKGGRIVTKPIVFAAGEKEKPVPKPIKGFSPVTDKPLRGNASLAVSEPTVLSLPQTQNSGKKATLALRVRGMTPGHRRFFSAYNGGPAAPKEFYFDVLGEDQTIRFCYDDKSVVTPKKTADVLYDGKPHHIAAVWNDGAVTLYLDGKEVAAGEVGKGDLALALGDLRFGEDYPPASLTNEPFLGEVDDVLVLRDALSPEQIATLSAEGTLPESADKGVYYTMDAGLDEWKINDTLTADGAQDMTLPGPGQTELLLNVSTSAAGTVRCELQTPDGKPIPGYTLADCDPIYGDEIARAVTWHGSSEVTPLAGKPVRIVFELQDADVYAFQFE